MNKNLYEYRYECLREVFDALIETLLGKHYYNYGYDITSCDEISGQDIAYKFGRKYAKRYETILQRNARINDVKEKQKEMNDKILEALRNLGEND